MTANAKMAKVRNIVPIFVWQADNVDWDEAPYFLYKFLF